MSLLHIDTSLANSNNKVDTNIFKVDGNPFDLVYTFRIPRRDIKSFTLASAEIPIGFYNIRAPFNTCTIETQGTPYTFSIPEGYYPGISDIVAALNNYTVTNPVGNALGTFFVNGSLIGFNCSNDPVIFTTQSGNQPNVLAMIGFYDGQYIDGNGYATIPFRITFDTYIVIYLPFIAGSSSEPSNITFKVPVNTADQIFYTEATSFTQTIANVTSSSPFRTLKIQVFDRFGNLLNNNGLDWSLTLKIR